MVNVVYSNTSHFCWDSQLHVYLRKTGGSITKVEAGAKKKALETPKHPNRTKQVQQRSNSVTWTRYSAWQKGRHVYFTIISEQNNNKKSPHNATRTQIEAVGIDWIIFENLSSTAPLKGHKYA